MAFAVRTGSQNLIAHVWCFQSSFQIIARWQCILQKFSEIWKKSWEIWQDSAKLYGKNVGWLVARKKTTPLPRVVFLKSNMPAEPLAGLSHSARPSAGPPVLVSPDQEASSQPRLRSCGRGPWPHGWEYHWKIKSLGDSKIKFWAFRARFQLYWNHILQVNTRWKALAEICTMHAFAPFSDLEIFVKFYIFQKVRQIFRKCCCFFAKSMIFRCKFHRELPEFPEILNHFQNSMNFISEQVCFNFRSRNL